MSRSGNIASDGSLWLIAGEACLHTPDFETAVHKEGAVLHDEQHIARPICFPGDPVALLPEQLHVLAVQAHWLAAGKVHPIFGYGLVSRHIPDLHAE